MPDDFVIARNPEQASSLPFVLRIPYGEQGILLEAEIVERVQVRSCVRRGAAIDLVSTRGRR